MWLRDSRCVASLLPQPVCLYRRCLFRLECCGLLGSPWVKQVVCETLYRHVCRATVTSWRFRAKFVKECCQTSVVAASLARTDYGGQNFFSSIAFSSSYLISVNCMPNHGEMC